MSAISKPFIDCPYQEPLAIVMRKAYEVGHFNAPVFATEGTASVGVVLAPLTAFICGLGVAVGDSASFGLPSRLMLPQILLNVSLMIIFTTNGAALLSIFWYAPPGSMFGEQA